MRLTNEQVTLLSLCKIKGVNWYFIAREAQRPGGLQRLREGAPVESSPDATHAVPLLTEHASADAFDKLRLEALAEVDKIKYEDTRLVTVLDADYPANLRLIYNLPPFLFVRGDMADADLRSVAVVGTREASTDGVKRAGRMARLLVEQDVTVVSGMARGIDTAAHTAALDGGGRTLAVLGTGINRSYPTENRALAERIVQRGALVSQFWPDGPPATYTFPRRNVTMSGVAQGTVVIEASNTSGAKMQARVALEHGKKVFLIKSLTENQPWARRYVTERGAVQVEDVKEVVAALASPDRVQAADQLREQMVLDFA